jgi:hypothetical protein
VPTNTDDFALGEWLSDIASDGSLTKEEIQSLSTILGKDKVTGKLKNQFLMQRDYSRKTQELADQRTQVQNDVEAILAERADLAKWKQGVDGQLQKAYNDLDTSRTSLAQFQARMQTISDQTGIPVDELTKGMSAARAATGDAAVNAANNNGNGGSSTFDPAKFVPRDEFNSIARKQAVLNAMVDDIVDEVRDITGKPFKMVYKDASGVEWTGRTALLRKAEDHNNQAARTGARGMTLREFAETEFQIPQLRQTNLEKDIEKRVTERLEAEYKTKLSSELLNGTPGRTSPLPDQPKSVLFDKQRDQRTPAEREAAERAANGTDTHDGRRTEVPPTTTAAAREERWQKAARSYADRRAQGVPIGQEAPAKSGAL